MSSERIFPLLDRRTPLLDRLENGKGENFTRKVAKEVAAVREADEDEALELMETFSDNFKQAMADEIGEDPEDINPELVEDFMSLMFFEQDFTVEQEESGDGEEEEEDSSSPLDDLAE